MVSRARLGVLACLVSQTGGVRLKREGNQGPLRASVAGHPIRNYRADASDFIVVFNDGTDEASIEKSCQGRCHLSGTPGKGGLAFAAVRGEDSLSEVVSAFPEAIEMLAVDELDFLIPELDVGLESDIAENSASWGLDAINLPKALATGKGVHVYVQDTGIRPTHQEFGGRVVPTIDLTGSSLRECEGDLTCALDRQGHGTHCAGTVGGKTFGVAPDVSLHTVKTLSDWGGGARSWQYSAIDWITANGQRPAVVSMSLGGNGRDEVYPRVIDAAVAAGVVVVVAAGNSNTDSCQFSPAFATGAITVGATTSANTRAGYSNYGPCNNIFAPGSAIVSASVSSDVASVALTGTSMACPHVSGAVALVQENFKAATSSEILAAFQRTGRKGFITGLREADPDVFLTVDQF